MKISRGASRQISQAIAWWRSNRAGSPNLLEDELQKAVLLLRIHPDVGSRASSARLPGVRRILLEPVRYHLYNRVTESGAVHLLALWHTSRGSGPPI